MDIVHFAEFAKQRNIHHTIDTYSRFQWATVSSSEKADCVIIHFLKIMAI